MSLGLPLSHFQRTCTFLFSIRRCMAIKTVIYWHDEICWSPDISRELANNCLTGYGLVTVCVSRIFVIIDSDNGSLPNRHQAITWNNADVSLMLLSEKHFEFLQNGSISIQENPAFSEGPWRSITSSCHTRNNIYSEMRKHNPTVGTICVTKCLFIYAKENDYIITIPRTSCYHLPMLPFF